MERGLEALKAIRKEMAMQKNNPDKQHSKGISAESPTERPERLYRLKDVLQLIPISKSSWFEGIKTGKYPAGHKLSERTTVWKESDLRALIDSL
jgi:predicted DNA-binding transcriptional regulator AlpA